MPRRPPRFFLPWFCSAVLCSALMWTSPGEETIPLHIGWVGLCLSYGFALWPLRITVLSIAGYAVVSGSVLVVRAQNGVLGWQETAEIPLMATMAFVMAWHVARRVEAMERVRGLAAAERTRLQDRERLARTYSHEMRTPLTIARGYVSLLQAQPLTPEQLADLTVVDDELSTLERVGDRLVRMLVVADLYVREAVDVDALITEVTRRWRTVAQRQWVVDSRLGELCCSRERLRMCLDTLIENALRYTDEDDTIRVFAHEEDGEVVIGVADSGTGLPDTLRADINRPSSGATPEEAGSAIADMKAQTGLGLALVRQVAEARGGLVRAEQAEEGGALIAMVVPRTSPATPQPAGPPAASAATPAGRARTRVTTFGQTAHDVAAHIAGL